MELRHLKYFVTVADEGSITKAAERLLMAQPPLSRQIQALEEELGVSLFSRGKGRQTLLTKEGRLLYPYAKQILDLTFESITAVKTAFARGEGGVTAGETNNVKRMPPANAPDPKAAGDEDYPTLSGNNTRVRKKAPAGSSPLLSGSDPLYLHAQVLRDALNTFLKEAEK